MEFLEIWSPNLCFALFLKKKQQQMTEENFSFKNSLVGFHVNKKKQKSFLLTQYEWIVVNALMFFSDMVTSTMIITEFHMWMENLTSVWNNKFKVFYI